jgi:VanZ family protein
MIDQRTRSAVDAPPQPPAAPTRTFGGVLWRILPALCWAVLIFVMSAQSELPGLRSSLLDLLLKKGSHFAEYFVLAVLLHHALGPRFPWGARARYVVAWSIAVLYAATDEFHQSFVPGRTPSHLDVMIDASGAILGLVCCQLVEWWRVARLPDPRS